MSKITSQHTLGWREIVCEADTREEVLRIAHAENRKLPLQLLRYISRPTVCEAGFRIVVSYVEEVPV